jgi:hypothetical protein
MPRYFFDIKDGHRLVDPSGVECANDHSAIEYGRRMAAKLALEASHLGRSIAIVDATGQQIATVRIDATVRHE